MGGAGVVAQEEGARPPPLALSSSTKEVVRRVVQDFSPTQATDPLLAQPSSTKRGASSTRCSPSSTKTIQVTSTRKSLRRCLNCSASSHASLIRQSRRL